jgi:ubiquinone/menaquinone biosynthesis C-methylase UbiE
MVKYVKNKITNYYSKSALFSLACREKFVIDKLTNMSPGLRILDAGAGTMKYAKYCKHLNYISHDFCQYDGEGDGKTHQSLNWDVSAIQLISDIESIPEADSSFDIILCTDVLEHVPDVCSTLREFDRLLRKGGQLIITVPTACEAHQTPFFFSGGYTNYFFESYLGTKLGYEVVVGFESDYFETLDQKIYLGLINITNLSKAMSLFKLFAAGYLVLSLPLVIFIRIIAKSMTKFKISLKETANNGCLVAAQKKV